MASVPAWSEIENNPQFSELTPEQKIQSLDEWTSKFSSLTDDPAKKELFEAFADRKRRRLMGEEVPEAPLSEYLPQFRERKMREAADAQGFLEQMGGALKTGTADVLSGLRGTFNAYTGDKADLAESLAQMAETQKLREQQTTSADIEFQRQLDENEAQLKAAQGFFPKAKEALDYAAIAATNPRAVAKQIVGQAPNIVSGLAAQVAGGLLGAAASGAQATLATGGLGTVPAALAGFVGGGITANTLLETMPQIYQNLMEKTNGQAAQMSTPEIKSYLEQNPDIVTEGIKKGLTRGAVIGSVEALFSKLGGRILSAPERAQMKALQGWAAKEGLPSQVDELAVALSQNPELKARAGEVAGEALSKFTKAGSIGRQAAGVASEGAGGAAGEIAAAVATGEEISPTEAFLEALGEVGMGLGSNVVNKALSSTQMAYNKLRVNQTVQKFDTASTLVNNADATGAAPNAVQAAKTAVETAADDAAKVTSDKIDEETEKISDEVITEEEKTAQAPVAPLATAAVEKAAAPATTAEEATVPTTPVSTAAAPSIEAAPIVAPTTNVAPAEAPTAAAPAQKKPEIKPVSKKKEAKKPSMIQGELPLTEAEPQPQTKPTDARETQVQETGGLPTVEGKPVVQPPAVQAQEGAAQRQGEGQEEVAKKPRAKKAAVAPVAAAAAPATEDAEYMAAVEAGDVEKAQRMVDEAATPQQLKDADPKVVKELLKKIKGLREAEERAGSPYGEYNKAGGITRRSDNIQAFLDKHFPKVLDANGNLVRTFVDSLGNPSATSQRAIIDRLTGNKLLAILRDRSGNVIPLSQRFPKPSTEAVPPVEATPAAEAAPTVEEAAPTAEPAAEAAPTAEPAAEAAPTEAPKLTERQRTRLSRKGVTKERLDKLALENKKLAEEFRKSFGQANVGFDPAQFALALRLAKNSAETGAVKFVDFALDVRELLPDLWDKIKYYLSGVWNQLALENDEIEEAPSPREAKKLIDQIDAETETPAAETTVAEMQPAEAAVAEAPPAEAAAAEAPAEEAKRVEEPVAEKDEDQGLPISEAEEGNRLEAQFEPIDKPLGFGRYQSKSVQVLLDENNHSYLFTQLFDDKQLQEAMQNTPELVQQAREVVQSLPEYTEFRADSEKTKEQLDAEREALGPDFDAYVNKLNALKMEVKVSPTTGAVLLSNPGAYKKFIASFGGFYNYDNTEKAFVSRNYQKFADFANKVLANDMRAFEKQTGLQRKVTDVRRELDEAPDQSMTIPAFTQGKNPMMLSALQFLVTENARKGRLTQKAAQDQLLDATMIDRAYKEGKPMFLLGSEAGYGKTFVIAMAIKRILLDADRPLKITYYTLSQKLVKQAKDNLADYDVTQYIDFKTYANVDSMKEEDVSENDIVIFDESQSIRFNTRGVSANRAKMALNITDKAKFTIFSSATPYEDIRQMRYIWPSGVFKPFEGRFLPKSDDPKISEKGWYDFAIAAGAEPSSLNVPNPNLSFPKTEEAQKNGDIDFARNYLIKNGMFSFREADVSTEMYDTEFNAVDADPAYLDLADKIVKAFEGIEGLDANDKGFRTNLLKRVLEYSKIPAAVQFARQKIEEDPRSKVAIFMETRSERERSLPEQIAAYEHLIQTKEDLSSLKPNDPRYVLFPKMPNVIRAFRNLVEMGVNDINFASLQDVYTKEFGDSVVFYSGNENNEQREAAVNKWSNGDKKVLAATMASGGTGLSLHDTSAGGQFPRVQINVNLPWVGSTINQVTRRTVRTGMTSKAHLHWLFAKGIPIEEYLAKVAGGRLKSMGLLVTGDAGETSTGIQSWNISPADTIPVVSETDAIGPVDATSADISQGNLENAEDIQRMISMDETPELDIEEEKARLVSARNSEYMRAVTEGDTGTDGLQDFLNTVPKNERENAVNKWLKRNPNSAKSMMDFVIAAAKNAGYLIGEVYHGTKKKFWIFNAKKGTENVMRDAVRTPQMFSTRYDFAEEYGRVYGKGDKKTPTRVVTAFLKADKVWDFENPNDVNEAMKARFVRRELETGAWDAIESPEFQQWLKDNGYDGFTNKERYAKNYAVYDPAQIKSSSPVTLDNAGNVIPLSERFNPESPDIRRFIGEPSSEKDAEYMAAVEAGDMEKAQRMVDEAARAAGYKEVFRAVRGKADPLKAREGYQTTFTTRKEVADSYGQKNEDTRRYFINDSLFKEFPSKDGNFSKLGFDREVISDGFVVARNVYDTGPFASLERDPSMGFSYPSDVYGTTKASTVIKSAEPVTYDDAGNVIPLSQRFQQSSPDIRRAATARQESPIVSPEDFRRGLSFVESIIANSKIPVIYDTAENLLKRSDLSDAEKQVVSERNTPGFFSKGRAFIVTDKVKASKKYKSASQAAAAVIFHELLHGGSYVLRNDPRLAGVYSQWVSMMQSNVTVDQINDLVTRGGYVGFADWETNPTSKLRAMEEIFVRKVTALYERQGNLAFKEKNLLEEFFSLIKRMLASVFGVDMDKDSFETGISDALAAEWGRKFINAISSSNLVANNKDAIERFIPDIEGTARPIQSDILAYNAEEMQGVASFMQGNEAFDSFKQILGLVGAGGPKRTERLAPLKDAAINFIGTEEKEGRLVITPEATSRAIQIATDLLNPNSGFGGSYAANFGLESAATAVLQMELTRYATEMARKENDHRLISMLRSNWNSIVLGKYLTMTAGGRILNVRSQYVSEVLKTIQEMEKESTSLATKKLMDSGLTNEAARSLLETIRGDLANAQLNPDELNGLAKEIESKARQVGGNQIDPYASIDRVIDSFPDTQQSDLRKLIAKLRQREAILAKIKQLEQAKATNAERFIEDEFDAGGELPNDLDALRDLLNQNTVEVAEITDRLNNPANGNQVSNVKRKPKKREPRTTAKPPTEAEEESEDINEATQAAVRIIKDLDAFLKRKYSSKAPPETVYTIINRVVREFIANPNEFPFDVFKASIEKELASFSIDPEIMERLVAVAYTVYEKSPQKKAQEMAANLLKPLGKGKILKTPEAVMDLKDAIRDAIRNRDELDYPNFAARYSAEFQKYKVPAKDANKLAESAFIRSVALKQDSLTKKANRIKESLLGGSRNRLIAQKTVGMTPENLMDVDWREAIMLDILEQSGLSKEDAVDVLSRFSATDVTRILTNDLDPDLMAKEAERASKSVSMFIKRYNKALNTPKKDKKLRLASLRGLVKNQVRVPLDKDLFNAEAARFGATSAQAEELRLLAAKEASLIEATTGKPATKFGKLIAYILSEPALRNDANARSLAIENFLRDNGYDEGQIKATQAWMGPIFDKYITKAKERQLTKLINRLESNRTRQENLKAEKASKIKDINQLPDSAFIILKKQLELIRAGLGTFSDPAMALASKMGFEGFRPEDAAALAELDFKITKALEDGRPHDMADGLRELYELLSRRKAPKTLLEVVAISYNNSALSGLSTMFVNVLSPIGSFMSRVITDVARLTAQGKFDQIKFLMSSIKDALKKVVLETKYGLMNGASIVSMSQQVQRVTTLQGDATNAWNVIKGVRRSNEPVTLRKKLSAYYILASSYTDIVRRVLSTLDHVGFSLLQSYTLSSKAVGLMAKAGKTPEQIMPMVFALSSKSKNLITNELSVIDKLKAAIEAVNYDKAASLKIIEEMKASEPDAGDPDYRSFLDDFFGNMRRVVAAFNVADTIRKQYNKESRRQRNMVYLRAQDRSSRDMLNYLSDSLPGVTPEQVASLKEYVQKEAEYDMGVHMGEESPWYDVVNLGVNQIRRVGNAILGQNPIFGRMLIGYFGIPANLLNRAMWFTPYGLYRLGLNKWTNKDGQFYQQSMATQEQLQQRLTEALIGTAGIAFLLMLKGLSDDEDEVFNVTLSGPSNKTEKDAWRKMGHREGSIEINAFGKVVSLNWARGPLEPAKVALLFIGALDDMKLNRKLGAESNVAQTVSDYLAAVMSGWSRQASFFGAKSTAGAVLQLQPDANLFGQALYKLNPLFPFSGMISSVEKLIAGPDIYRGGMGAVYANLPIARSLLTERAVNALGDNQGLNPSTAWSKFNDRAWYSGIPLMISGTPTGRDEAVYDFILSRGTGPGLPQRTAIEFENGGLKDREWLDFVAYRGTLIKNEMFRNLSRLRRMDDDSLSTALSRISNEATKKAKRQFRLK